MDIRHILHEYTWLLILMAIGLGMAFPGPGSSIHGSVFYLLMVMMVISFFKVDPRKIVTEWRNLPGYALILAIIHLSTPLVLFFFKGYFDPEVFLGLVIVSSTSAGVSVIFLSDIYGGDSSKAMIITTISHLLNPIVIPAFALMFAGETLKISVASMLKTIVQLVIIPLIVSEVIKHFGLHKRTEQYNSIINMGLMLVIIYSIIGFNRAFIMGSFFTHWGIYALGFIFSLATFFAGYMSGKDKKERITFGISSSFKNFTLAIVLASALFSEKVALGPISYCVVNNILLAPAHLFIKHKK